MRIFSYWSTITEPIDGSIQETTVYGGSNISVTEAKRDAKERLQYVIARINGDYYNKNNLKTVILPN